MHFSISYLALACLALLKVALAGFHVHDQSFAPDYVLEATAKNVTINCQSRYSVVVNGTYPGPPIYMKEGQTTWIRVWNRIPDQNFTMHWHGLTQRTAPFSDGTPLVSQWPIKPGEFFDYEIHPEIGDAGTYFYHSHVGFQQITANGALVVDDAGEPPYQYDEERFLTFGDYYPKNDSEIEHGLLADPFKWSGEPAAVALEGHTGTASFLNATDNTCTPLVIDVEAGKTYRMRMIGKTAISLMKFGIEDHDDLEVIEADGQYTKPVMTDTMQVGPGQRFSFIFRAKSVSELEACNKTVYWVRYESRDRPTVVSGYALVRYHIPNTTTRPSLPQALPTMSPVILPNITYNWLEYAFQSLNSSSEFPPLTEVTRTIYIQMNQALVTGAYVNKTLNGTVVWVQNNLTWQENVQDDYANTPPYLISAYVQDTTPNYTTALNNHGYDPATKAFPALVGETIDIVWLSNSGPTSGFDFHPLHAHGEHYWDLGSGNGTYNATQNEQHFSPSHASTSSSPSPSPSPPTTSNTTHFTPARRDTTILYRYSTSSPNPYTTSGWRAWRIRITESNVGAWMMHCHIAQHAVMGMNTIWVFGDAASITREFPAPPYVNGYLEFGGSAYGNDSYDPLVNHYFGDGDDR